MEENQEFEAPVTTKQVAMKWGLYLGMAMILYGMILQLTGQIGNQALGYINYLFVAILMFFAHKEFKESGNGFMSYKQGLGLGMIMVLIGSVISSLWSYIYLKFIDDSMLDIIKEKQLEEFEKQNMSDAQIDQAMAMMERFSNPEMIVVFAIVFGVFFGFIVSLIISAITKNPDPAQEF